MSLLKYLKRSRDARSNSCGCNTPSPSPPPQSTIFLTTQTVFYHKRPSIPGCCSWPFLWFNCSSSILFSIQYSRLRRSGRARGVYCCAMYCILWIIWGSFIRSPNGLSSPPINYSWRNCIGALTPLSASSLRRGWLSLSFYCYSYR